MLTSASNLSCSRNRNSSVGLGVTGSVNFFETYRMERGHQTTENWGYMQRTNRLNGRSSNL